MFVDSSISIKTEICNICNGKLFKSFAKRSDNVEVIICQKCGMGALESFPINTASFYSDGYYGSGAQHNAAGYVDYDVSSEHGVLWASELLQVIKGGGRILDVGCANGFLLNSLGGQYQKFGIEANHNAAKIAESKGVVLIGSDILDETLLLKYAGYFDVITAVAVFEHITHFKEAVEMSVKMLKPDGVLIFEVPLISEKNNNETWLKTSLEHLYYPTIKGLKYLFDEELKVSMIGDELLILDYASTYVGVVTCANSEVFEIEKLFNKILHESPSKLTIQERRVQLVLKIIHAANPLTPQLSYVKELFESKKDTPFLSRSMDLWKETVRRLENTKSYLNSVEEAKAWHKKNLDMALLERDRVVLERDSAQAELYRVYRSLSWRLTKPLRIMLSWGKLTRHSAIGLLSRIEFILAPDRIEKGISLLANGNVKALGDSFKEVVRRSAKQTHEHALLESVENHPLLDGQPLVSVVIPCFNYGHFVVDAIDSVLAQTLKDVEILVIDGGSTDENTVDTLMALERPRTRVIFRSGRHLVGDNRNFGIANASGRYICCLDADDTLEPTYLEKAAFHLETYGYDIVSTSMRFFGARDGHLDTTEFPNLADMTSGNHVLTCAVFDRKLWEISGGYVDIGLGKEHVAEDWDFWLRLAANGARIRNMSREYLFNYRIHQSGSLSSGVDVRPLDVQKKAILERNKELLTKSAYKFSTAQQARHLRANPSATALAQSVGSAISNSKKTLLLVMPFFLVGGAERLLSGLCEYLVNHGWNVIVVSTLRQDPAFGSSLNWFKKSSSEIYALPGFLNDQEITDFITYLLTSRKPDCLLNTGSKLIYELLPSIKTWYEHISIVDLLFNTVGHVESHLEQKKHISFAMAENKQVVDWFLNVAGWTTNQVQLVSSGVDLSRYYPKPRPEELVHKYNIRQDELVVGFSGRLSKEKAPDIFVEIAKLCDGISNLRFIMTGAGPMTEDISKLVRALPESIKFNFVGLVDDVDQYLSLYDVLVLPSRFDGRPLVVMEALACGIPVVASSVGGLADLISDGLNGFLVEAANSKLFSARIRRLAEDRELVSKLKIDARLSAEVNLDSNDAYFIYERALSKAISIDAEKAVSLIG